MEDKIRKLRRGRPTNFVGRERIRLITSMISKNSGLSSSRLEEYFCIGSEKSKGALWRDYRSGRRPVGDARVEFIMKKATLAGWIKPIEDLATEQSQALLNELKNIFQDTKKQGQDELRRCVRSMFDIIPIEQIREIVQEEFEAHLLSKL
ncbi:hypothetical protein [Ferriphaselus amnicola]|nr:hypothetical protein [Ferriphaselus amnicola]